ncbi:MAG: hypothetical protein BroJett011_04320 [Chloroflexota bacterium]|nr:MAG: hypothetical protein BroJett011_04320 [Chloroflexota bacterium]
MKPKFKSDARPSDTKSVVLHKENDARLLAHLATIKRESEFWRRAGYFYLDFMAWLSTQPEAPDPNRPFVYYQRWLESHPTPDPQSPPPIDPASLSASLLPGVRDVVEAALSTALAGASFLLSPPGAGGEGELADLFSAELVLE